MAINFSERDIEDWLFGNPQIFAEAIGADDFKWIARQYRVPSGIVDLIGLSWDNTFGDSIGLENGNEVLVPEFVIHVVELKADELKSVHIAQVVRYASDIFYSCGYLGTLAAKVEIQKHLMGIGHISSDLMFAAEATEVQLRTFEHTFEIAGQHSWKPDFSRHVDNERERIAATLLQPILSPMMTLSVPARRDWEKRFPR